MSRVRKILGVNRKTFIDPAGWLGYRALKDQTFTIYTILKGLFAPAKPEREETFEEAMVRLNVTEDDLNVTLKSYQTNALIFAIIGLIIFLYAFYLLFSYYHFFAWLLALSASFILFSQAFRFDFWALQIKKRKLGLTFNDWKRSILSGE